MLRLSLTLLALLALPAPAQAAESFLGVTEEGTLVRFTSQEPYSLTTPQAPRGLVPGERIVALGSRPGGVVAVGSSARLYAIDPLTGRASPIGQPFPQGLRGSRFSLAVAPGSTSARLVSDVGQDLLVDLASGATTPGPGLRRANGEQVRPAADAATDGRLVGVQLSPREVLRETGPGAGTMASSPLEAPSGNTLGEPIGFQLGADGNGYVLAVLSDLRRERQSALLRVDPATGKLVGGVTRAFKILGRRLTTFASLGTVPDDRTRPRVSTSLPRTISARALAEDGRLPLRVRSSEAAQLVVSLRIAGQGVGFGFVTRDTPGVLRIDPFVITGRDKTRVRRAVGKRVRLVIGVNDLKGNRRSLVRTARLVR